METLIVDYIDSFSYFAIVLLLVGASFGFPVPKNLTMLVAGVLAAKGMLNLFYVITFSITGTVLGDLSLYALGRHYGLRVIKLPALSKMYSEKRFRKLQDMFKSRGAMAIIWARFTPVIRTGIYLAAGTARYRITSFILLDLLTAVFLCPPICLLGYVSYGELQKLESGVNTVQMIIALAILIVISIAALRYFWVKWIEAKNQNSTT